jgi:hypothetical protein
MLAILHGIKCFAWFTTHKEQNVCFVIELNKNKQIQNDGRILMDTCGVMTNEQFRFLYDLLYYAEIQLTRKNIENLKLYIPLNNDYEIYEINDTKYPIYVKLGYTTNK